MVKAARAPSGALIYVRPANNDCLLYRVYSPGICQAYVLADKRDANNFAASLNLKVVHDDLLLPTN